MQRYLAKLVTYIQESKQELKKVNWPSRQETLWHTILVVAVSVTVAVFLGGLDAVFTFVLNRFVL